MLELLFYPSFTLMLAFSNKETQKTMILCCFTYKLQLVGFVRKGWEGGKQISDL